MKEMKEKGNGGDMEPKKPVTGSLDPVQSRDICRTGRAYFNCQLPRTRTSDLRLHFLVVYKVGFRIGSVFLSAPVASPRATFGSRVRSASEELL